MTASRTLWLLVFLALLLACAPHKPVHKYKARPPTAAIELPSGGLGAVAPAGDYAVVRTFFASDRSLTGSTDPVAMFGNDRSAVRYGVCDVSIPRDHRMGEIERPSIWRFEFREDPDKHVVLLGTMLEAKPQFFDELAARVHASARKSAFVFVHGYNVSFADAARRTAQMSYDLGFDGAPVFYSWPSQGETAAYTVDEQSIEWTQTDLRNFLDDFFARSDAQDVYLIAHSMGNRALTRAVAELLAGKPAIRVRLKEVILAAPDIDADVFKRDIAPALVAAGRPVTLYASSQDKALLASKVVHGYPRAGDTGNGILVLGGIETIDASLVDTSFLGHSYFAEETSVLTDIFHLIHDGKPADQREGLLRIEATVGRYWRFRGPGPDAPGGG